MEKELGQSVKQRRQAMPTVASFIDMCRQAYGVEYVDALLATAQQARRDHARVLAEQGELAARRWHRANAHVCTFSAQENGRTLGLPSPWGQATTTAKD